MNILQVNKFFYLRRGAERYFFELSKLLEKKGHNVIHFSMHHPENLPSSYSKYFVSNLELGKMSDKSWLTKFKEFGRIFYSFEAKRKIAELLKNEKVDIAHLNLIYHQISPSILGEIKKQDIPIVMTLHDYKLICPNYILYTKDEVCQRCFKYRYFNAVKYKCLKNSYAISSVAMMEMYFHKLFRFYEKYVDYFIAPSQFVKDKHCEFGIREEKIKVIPHFSSAKFDKLKEPDLKKQPYFLFIGSFFKEKGIIELIDYWKKGNFPVDLYLAGDGPLFEKLKQENLMIKNIKFLGRLSQEKLGKVLQGALSVIVPSVVYETFGLSILEAYQAEKSVIASRIGALPEIVSEGETGFLFDIKNREDFNQKIKGFLNLNEDKIKQLGRNGYLLWKNYYNEDLHYNRIFSLYKSLI